MIKKISILVISLFLLIAFVGCSSDSTSKTSDTGSKAKEDKPIVGFIFIEKLGNTQGWTASHNEGRLALEKELGVRTIVKEAVPENEGVINIITDMIEKDGATVIVGTSFGYYDYLLQMSKKYPNVKFMHCSGPKEDANLSVFFGRIYESRYLSGIVAGMKTRTNAIGYVAAFEIPEVISGLNAFTLGVRSVNPNAKVIVDWTHTWIDEEKAKASTEKLISKGVDIIAQHQDSIVPQKIAEEKGIFSIGYHTDMSKAAPKAVLTSPIWDWGKFYVSEVRSVMDGTWKARNYWGTMQDGVVKLAPLSNLAPEGAAAKVSEQEKKIKDGTLKIFEGPIKDNKGNLKIAAGKVLVDSDIASLDWLVEGVEGEIVQVK